MALADADLLFKGDLLKQFGQHGRAADVAGRERGRADFQCFLVDPAVDPAPADRDDTTIAHPY